MLETYIPRSDRSCNAVSIPLTGKHSNLSILIDKDDEQFVRSFFWNGRISGKKVYAWASKQVATNGKAIPIHRLLTDCPDGMQVDHINGDSLDNRRSNLRICESRQNHKNKTKMTGTTSKFKGVYWSKLYNRWVAIICNDGKKIYLGKYWHPIYAARCYDRAALEMFGEYAKTNKMMGLY